MEGDHMPGFILHMLHGELFLKKSGIQFSDTELKQFKWGLLMPDLYKVKRQKDNGSHFFSDDQDGKILQVPDLKSFQYIAFMDNPFVLGYAAHLYLDKLFFEDYFQQYVRFLDADGNVTLENDRVDSVFLVKSQRHITVDELFSESYLYGDYAMLNQFLVKKYAMKLLEETPVNDPIFQTNQDDQKAISDALEKFLTDSTGSTEMNVFTVESLEQALEKYAFGFSQWVEGVRTLLA